MFQLFFLLAMPFSLDAHAQDTASAKAERVQIRRKLRRLIKRNAWEGVDESYRRLLELGPDALTYDDHIQGAIASRELGELSSLIDRLSMAVEKNPDADEKSWLSAIKSQCSTVKIWNQRRHKYKLIIDDAPFEMEYNKAISVAEKKLHEEGRFEGYLPNGRYAFGAQVFDVQQGLTADVVASGAGTDGFHPYALVSLGGMHMTSGSGDNPPMAFTAPETNIGVGLQLSFGNWVFNEELVFDGVYMDGAWFAAGSVGSSVGWQLPLVTPYVGAVFSWGHLYRKGLILTNADELCNCEDAAQRAKDYEKDGQIRSFGPHIGLRYDLTPRIALDVRLGSRNDTSRWYYSGNTAIHIALGK